MLLKITHLSSLVKSLWRHNHQVLVKLIFHVLFCIFLAQVSVKGSKVDSDSTNLRPLIAGKQASTSNLTSSSETSTHIFKCGTPLLLKYKQSQYCSSIHIAKIYISGSMCFACLRQLKHKLKLLRGVHVVRLDLSALKKHSFTQVVRKRAALLMVSYDTNKLSLSHIEQFVTNNDFQITKIQDKKL